MAMSSSSGSVIKEERHDEAEIRELAAKLVEANKNKVASTMARQGAAGPQMNLINYFPKKNDGKRTAAPNPAPAPDDGRKTADDESVRGRFGWVQLGKCHIPYIFRTNEKYCAVRMVEMKLLNKYLNYLHQDIYSCTCIRSYYITESESRLLNEINIKHCDYQFGKDAFTCRDLIVRLSDANEFYNFLDVCYSKLIQGSCNPKDRCGFIRINKESVVPYTVKNDNKYVPLFYFEGETENLKMKADQLEGWDLSYLKFCCKVQGIRNELFAHDSCAVISLNAIKSYFPPGTGFEDYWPSKVVDTQLLLNGKNSSQMGQWTRQPPTPPISGQKYTQQQQQQQQTNKLNHNNVIQHQAAHPQQAMHHVQQQQPVPPPSSQNVQALYNAYAGLVGGQPTFQNVPVTSQAGNQVTAARMAQNQAAVARLAACQNMSTAPSRPMQRHQYYPPPQLQAPPPLVRSTVPPTTGTSTTYSSPQSVMMIQDLNGISQQYPLSAAVAAAAAARNNVQIGQRFPPPLIPVRSVNGSQRYHSYPTNNANDVVDLSPSYMPRNSNNTPYPEAFIWYPFEHNLPRAPIRNNIPSEEPNPNHMNMSNGRSSVEIGKKLTPIAETPTSGTHIPYKLQKALVEGKMIPCINMKPYVWTELLITLPDIINYFFPSLSLSNCRKFMDVLCIELYRGNRQQMQILQEAGKCQTVNDNLPLVQVHDVIKFMPQMKYMFSSLLNEPLSKRQRTS